jgi:hypothetical protein
LDRLVIENGSVAAWDSGALSGMQIVKLSDPSPAYPVRTGELIFRNSKVASSAFLSDFIVAQGRIETLILEVTNFLF